MIRSEHIAITGWLYRSPGHDMVPVLIPAEVHIMVTWDPHSGTVESGEVLEQTPNLLGSAAQFPWHQGVKLLRFYRFFGGKPC